MTSVSIPAKDLVRVFNNALQGVAKTKDAVPILEAAHIKWADGFVVVSTTDRYVIIRDKVPSVEMDGTGSLLLPTAEIKNLIRMIGKNPGPVLVKLALNEDKLTVEVDGGASLTVAVEDVAGFPKLDSFFTSWENKALDFNYVALNPEILARLCKLKAEGPGIPLRFQLGETSFKALRFRIGEFLEGVIMPVRVK